MELFMYAFHLTWKFANEWVTLFNCIRGVPVGSNLGLEIGSDGSFPWFSSVPTGNYPKLYHDRFLPSLLTNHPII
jgi:hypothetical protein